MRILTISNCPLIETQGSGYVIVNFCRGLRSKGHEVDLFGPETFELLQFFQGKGRTYRQEIGMLILALRRLAKESYDVVEFYGAESWLSVLILSRIPKRKFLLVSHSNGLETYCSKQLTKYLKSTSLDGSPRRWYQIDKSFLSEQAFTRVDGLVTVSFYDRDYALEKAYQVDNRIAAIENPLAKEFLGLTPYFQRKRAIGFCGSWLLRKGIKTIQSDISKILFEFPDCVFKLIGVGKDFQKENHFSSEICSRIEVIPFITDKQELQKLYQSISILILPSVYESFGLVVAEAMACGCAVVASRTGFSASLQNRNEAMIMNEPGSPYLYNAVKELLLDEPLRLKIAWAGYDRVQSLRWDNAINKLESTYLRWLEEFRNLSF